MANPSKIRGTVGFILFIATITLSLVAVKILFPPVTPTPRPETATQSP